MEINANQVKELRDITGLGMMLCKKALIDANGNMETAIDNLRKQGQMTAAKRAGKAAKEGKVTIIIDKNIGIIYEVNSETDFVARNDDFLAYVKDLGNLLVSSKPATLEAARALTSPVFGGLSAEAKLTELIGKIGETMYFRRYRLIIVDAATEKLISYNHNNGKIGVIVGLKVGNPDALNSEVVNQLGKDLAMQVAAAHPMAVDRESVSEAVLAKEKEIYFTQAQSSGKPEKIWDKIVEGKLAKFFKENTLVEQAYIRDPETSVSDRIKASEKEVGCSIKPTLLYRYELGAED